MHIMKPSTPFESKITLIFAGVVLVLLVLAYTALQLTRHAQTLEKQVEHAQEVLDTLNAINVHTLHIDVKRQNFIITGDQTLLPPPRRPSGAPWPSTPKAAGTDAGQCRTARGLASDPRAARSTARHVGAHHRTAPERG